jgi:hypothetical protein
MKLFCLLALFLLAAPLSAGTGDSPPIHEGGVIFRGHANYVEAASSKTGKLLWRTYLYQNLKPKHYIPGPKHAPQVETVRSMRSQASHLEVEGKSHIYWLDKKSGQIINRILNPN